MLNLRNAHAARFAFFDGFRDYVATPFRAIVFLALSTSALFGQHFETQAAVANGVCDSFGFVNGRVYHACISQIVLHISL